MNNIKEKAILAKFTTQEKSYDLLNGYTFIGEYKSTKVHHIHIENASINAVLNITNDISAIYDVFSNDDILINNLSIKIEPLRWYNLDSKTNVQFGKVKCFFDKENIHLITSSDDDTIEFIDDDIIPCTQPESSSTSSRTRGRNSKKNIGTPVITESFKKTRPNTLNKIEKDIFNFENVPETQVNDYIGKFYNEDSDIEIPETQIPQDYLEIEDSNDTIIFHAENDSASNIQSQSQVVVNLEKSFDKSPDIESKIKRIEHRRSTNCLNENEINTSCVDENCGNVNNDDKINNSNINNNKPQILSVRSLSITENPILNFNDRSLSVTPDLIFNEDVVLTNAMSNLDDNILLDDTNKCINEKEQDMPATQLFVPARLLTNISKKMSPPSVNLQQNKNLNDVSAEQKLDSIYDQPTQPFEIIKGHSSSHQPEDNFNILTQKFVLRSKTPESDKKSLDHDDIYIQMKEIFESPKTIDSSSSINNKDNQNILKRKHPFTDSSSNKKCKVIVKRLTLNVIKNNDLDDTVPFNYLEAADIKQMCEKLKDSMAENKNQHTIDFLNSNFGNEQDSKSTTDKNIISLNKEDAKPQSTTKIKSCTVKMSNMKLSLEDAKKNDSLPSVTNNTKKFLRVRKNSESFLNSSFESTNSSYILRVKYNILFTKIKSDPYKAIIKQLGGRIVEKINEATILISSEANSTCKFLSAIGKGIPIVSLKWLDNSKKANKFLEPTDYILTNQKNEKIYKYNIKNTIDKSNQNGILAGFIVFSTPKMEIIPADVEIIVTMSGGEFYKNIKKYQLYAASKTDSNRKNKIIVISTKEDKSLWNQYKLLCKNVYIIDKAKFKMIILQHDINHIYK